MRRALLIIVPVMVLVLAPARAHAWGYEPHRFIMDRAIALLPVEIRPLFERHRALVVERVVDPDLWRDAGFDEESKNHFLDIDWEGFGPFPFAGLPREYSAAVAKFGVSRIQETGTLPWRVEEMYGNLRRAFEAYPRRGAFSRFAILHTAAWLSHYVGDAHVPLHAVVNYDGQLTGQNGVHTRWESLLFERYRDRLTIAPRALPPVKNPRDFIFDRVLEGTQAMPSLLASDREAIGSRDVYDDRYFSAFFASTRPLLERRLNESIAAVAAMIAGAWEAAGRPAVPVNPTDAPQRRRRP
jgi:hypothetical protein